MPPNFTLCKTLGPIQAQATIPLVGVADEQPRCCLAYQQFLDQAPAQTNIIYDFRVQARLHQADDGLALVITFYGLAGVGRYRR
ncbi:hypothetical protein I2492_01145 [Budviciaceae bacterium CWB-B4]|uniref:Uncharacterized protein n=1 Tax=Limnobaculum xujianqingii TaxID=2738837 RepID=A0A9D7AF68_9GAMM|nr:hypothetical protein [Limnobaculum xujianqingii]MBK5071620.1 hypothetical protein [Limnobaculum xujianqingii]MBK5174929.1 hypothetical protein [Limnobaculum xujianqingii]